MKMSHIDVEPSREAPIEERDEESAAQLQVDEVGDMNLENAVASTKEDEEDEIPIKYPSESSPFTDERLRQLNIAATILHGVQAIAQVIGSSVIPRIKDFAIPIVYTHLTSVKQNNTQGLATTFLTTTSEKVNNLALPGFITIFFFLSAAFQGATVWPFNKLYNKHISQGINYFRWFEYALSSSFMIIAIGALSGVRDVANLIQMFTLNATMNFFGLMMERVNQRTRKVDWWPFYGGCLCGVIPWVIIFMAFGGAGAEKAPGWVWGVLIGYIILFCTFPINMILQYLKYGKWADYRYGEAVYIILSLVAKTMLGWFVFGGANQPQGI